MPDEKHKYTSPLADVLVKPPTMLLLLTLYIEPAFRNDTAPLDIKCTDIVVVTTIFVKVLPLIFTVIVAVEGLLSVI